MCLHCDSQNIHYFKEPNASNYYVGRDTVVTVKGMVGIKSAERGKNNNARVRMYYIARGKIEEFSKDILPVSVAAHYDCILSRAPLTRASHV